MVKYSIWAEHTQQAATDSKQKWYDFQQLGQRWPLDLGFRSPNLRLLFRNTAHEHPADAC
jgi:hypothetical protein